jgi:hypothetical protein
MEEMQIGSKTDVNMGEFWNGISSSAPTKTPILRTPKLASSVSHINGQKITGAEAYTSEPDSSRWQEYPFALKGLGDKIFTCRSEPFSDSPLLLISRILQLFPGMTYGSLGESILTEQQPGGNKAKPG